MTEIKFYECNICTKRMELDENNKHKGKGVGMYGNEWRLGPLVDHFTHLCDDCISKLALLLSPVTHVMQGKAVCSFKPGDMMYLANDGLAHPVKKSDGFEPEEKLLHMYRAINECTWGFECGGDVVTGSYTKNEDDVTCFACLRVIASMEIKCRCAEIPKEESTVVFGVVVPQCPKCDSVMTHVRTSLRFDTPPLLTFQCRTCKHSRNIEA